MEMFLKLINVYGKLIEMLVKLINIYDEEKKMVEYIKLSYLEMINVC